MNLKGGLMYAGVNGNPDYQGHPIHNQFAPRGGIAWSLTDRHVVRAGYGFFWIPEQFNWVTEAVIGARGYAASTELPLEQWRRTAAACALLDWGGGGGCPFPSEQQAQGNSAGTATAGGTIDLFDIRMPSQAGRADGGERGGGRGGGGGGEGKEGEEEGGERGGTREGQGGCGGLPVGTPLATSLRCAITAMREIFAVEVKLVNSVAANSVAVNPVAFGDGASDGAASRKHNLPIDSTVNDNRLGLLRRNQCDSGKRYENRP